MTTQVEVESGSSVERVYAQLRSMAISYAFKPGERLNEVDLSKRLGVSRTPLRDALNRLTTEGLLRFIPGRGFSCRDLDVREIFSLYELRKAIEIAAIRLAIQRASDNDIDGLLEFLDDTGPDAGTRSTDELVQLDEWYHERLMTMSGNEEMLRVLRNVNARIQLVRWIDMNGALRPKTQLEHREILVALKQRDEANCVAALEKHIDRRLDQITAALREGYAHIYMPRQ